MSESRTDYAWYDGAVQSTVRYKPDTLGGIVHTSTFSYTGSGVLTGVVIADGRPRTITFTNDMNGQAIRRVEQGGDHTRNDPAEVWYRFGGKQLGYRVTS